ncbi:Phosphonate metabolism transcriptional regulator PhnF [Pseudodesulfovibrio profundus]|uniref:Phosphonate metabolism transcriptional regulator PhnF n=1 Tax=Pseudodesulfovibrio profundus TaxID=57320 RepID=A0A2C8FDN4_9BACT|nr:phosphonate metabolism transcriptional regulator PhnF [Pseudodesulfovibrio profundus]SOB60273.1 Phosphonate metabolism transcriptional regulator PhnF [Pseudodesulfovibrio profundus]
MLSRKNGMPLWRQIYLKIEADVTSGVFEPGQKLPSESEFTNLFSVNRHTIRRAMGALTDDGLVRVERGRGAFVREPVINYPVSSRTRFSENLTRQHRAPGNVLLMAVDTEADVAVAEALDIKEGEIVTRITSAGEADGRRVSYSNSFFPRTLFPGIVRIFREFGSVTRTLSHFGVDDYSRKRTRIISRMPTKEEAGELHQPKSRPVLITESINVDETGTPVEFGICLFASDWVQILVEPS